MHIILLNGPSSAGKTSLMRALQAILPKPYLATSLDHYIAMIPAHLNDYHGNLKPHPGFSWIREYDDSGQPLSHLTPGEYGEKVYYLFQRHVQHTADLGFNMIVDHVALLPDDYAQWKKILSHHTLLVIKVTAEPNILEQREQARGDRVFGVSRALQKTVHQNYHYDFECDTSNHSPEICAEIVYEKIANIQEKKVIHENTTNPRQLSTHLSRRR